MLTYQDLLQAKTESKLNAFIINAVDSYIVSSEYKNMIDAESYYNGENPAIINMRSEVAVGDANIDLFAKIRVPSMFFGRIVRQVVNRLWCNAIQLDTPENKDALGRDFDGTAKMIATYAAVHGVCYGYWNLDRLQMFKATEYLSLPDERTGEHLAGIRFWRIADNKPWIIQLYEIDGMTEYKRIDDKLEVVTEKQPYRVTIRRDALGEQIIDKNNYDALPVLPMYANSQKRSDLTTAVKAKIDLYDMILTSFGDVMLRTKSMYWLLRGYSGDKESLLKMRRTMEELGIIAPTDDTQAELKTVDVPYQATMEMLEKLEQEIYRDAGIMNFREISGGNLTNVAIQTAQFSEQIKTSDMEWANSEFVDRLLKLIGIDNNSILFKHETVSNDTEITQRLVSLAPFIDEQTILELERLIPPELVMTVMKRKELERLAMPIFDDKSDIEEDKTEA